MPKNFIFTNQDNEGVVKNWCDEKSEEEMTAKDAKDRSLMGDLLVCGKLLSFYWSIIINTVF